MPRSSSAKGRHVTVPKYTPTPKQKEFHQSPAQYRGFIGGFGSGKSVAGAMEAWKHIGLYPGSFGLIGRLSLRPSLSRRCVLSSSGGLPVDGSITRTSTNFMWTTGQA